MGHPQKPADTQMNPGQTRRTGGLQTGEKPTPCQKHTPAHQSPVPQPQMLKLGGTSTAIHPEGVWGRNQHVQSTSGGGKRFKDENGGCHTASPQHAPNPNSQLLKSQRKSYLLMIAYPYWQTITCHTIQEGPVQRPATCLLEAGVECTTGCGPMSTAVGVPYPLHINLMWPRA